MLTIDGLCEQLRRYNESKRSFYAVKLCGDTSCDLICLNTSSYQEYETGSVIQHFGNIYQLLEYLNRGISS